MRLPLKRSERFIALNAYPVEQLNCQLTDGFHDFTQVPHVQPLAG
jgi:hypothetical protein